ncbi:MAG TPA: glycosyltransferase family 4 protein [Victivallales bacterium]|nr:glycosyltransferase family 4 protein [Victivallales bacterium]
MKKILLVSSKYMPEYSGSGFRAHNLYRRLSAKFPTDISFNVIAGSTEFNENISYEYDGANVNRIACKPYPQLAGGLIRHYQIIRNFQMEYSRAWDFLCKLPEKPDLIHIFGKCYVAAAAWKFCAQHHIPVIIELCNEMNSPFQYVPTPFKIFFNHRLPEKYLFVAISESLRQVCLRNGIPDSKIWCRPNPVDNTVFYPVNKNEKIKIRRQITKFKEDNITLTAYVAKFRTSKNHIFLLDVMKRLPDRFKLFMKGPLVENGPAAEHDRTLFNKIAARITELGLDDRVELKAGFCSNIADYYRMTDIYLFPSINEGLGTPVLESIASGTPVVANTIPQVTNMLINDGENGFLSKLNPDEFAEKILLAEKITLENMKTESDKIITRAGCDVIDNTYHEQIMRLTSNNDN